MLTIMNINLTFRKYLNCYFRLQKIHFYYKKALKLKKKTTVDENRHTTQHWYI
jgi:hypothetical protein